MCQQTDLDLIRRIRTGIDGQAIEELVIKYLPMVRHIVKNQNTPPSEFDDFFQEGAVGLLKAIEQYDFENYQIKFSTFAYICILRRIYNKIKQNYTKKALMVSGSISLNCPLYDDGTAALVNWIPGNSEEPFGVIERDWVNERLDKVLKSYLSPLEYTVARLLLKGYSLGEIQCDLNLPLKVIDNARTRFRLKLKKVISQYGSLLNPNIPMKTRKRKDLAIGLRQTGIRHRL